jgi:diphthine synthase
MDNPSDACRGELYIVGIGLHPKTLTLEALEAINKADSVYLETYTSPGVDEMTSFLEKIRLGEKITRLTRKDVEEQGAREIINKLRNGEKVCFLVYGDPFVATTHNALRLEALRLGCRVNYVPGISVYHYSISATGLFNYKFGPSVTVVYPRWGIKFTSPYMTINENLERGLHTFVFLDIDEKLGPMTPDIAAKLLLEASTEFEKRNLNENSVVLVLERMGGPNEKIYCEKLGGLLNKKWGAPPYSLVIPSKLHFMEKDVLLSIGLGCNKLF